jgi:hypothetical protein
MNKNIKNGISVQLFRSSMVKRIVPFSLVLILIGASGSTISIPLVPSQNTFSTIHKNIIWNVTIHCSNSGGQNDYGVFGEAPDANDGPPADDYDVVKPPAPMPPYIRVWLDDNLPIPYDYLWEDYRFYPAVSKVWNLTVQWWPSSGSSPTDITMIWDPTEVQDSEYTSVTLCENDETPLEDMLVNNSYVFSCPAYVPQYFKILCEAANQPPVAIDDTATVPEDSSNNQINVLSNDYDPENDTLTIISVTQPTHGTSTMDGAFCYYTPTQHYHGSDAFTYTISDEYGSVDTATVSMTITVRQYYLTITIQGSGTVTKTPDQPWYTYGQVVTLTANPSIGWKFDHWSGDLTGGANPASVTMDGNKSVTAHFIELHYTLTITIQGQGSVVKNPDQPNYTYGQVVTLTANPSAGWAFNHWGGDLTGNTNPTTITMTGNKSVIANFTMTNHPPLTPGKPSGQSQGKVGVTYRYTAVTTDSENDQIYYQFDWGDGTMSNWVGPYDSGVLANASHSWTKKGSYGIKVKAKDTKGLESSWSNPLPITMPFTFQYDGFRIGLFIICLLHFLKGEYKGLSFIQMLRMEGFVK